MPKYLLLKHYRGGPAPHRVVSSMDQWAPEDVEAIGQPCIEVQRHAVVIDCPNSRFFQRHMGMTPGAFRRRRESASDVANVHCEGARDH